MYAWGDFNVWHVTACERRRAHSATPGVVWLVSSCQVKSLLENATHQIEDWQNKAPEAIISLFEAMANDDMDVHFLFEQLLSKVRSRTLTHTHARAAHAAAAQPCALP